MPETDTIPVSASIASTGTGIRYIGDYAYAYSGIVQASGSDTTALDFTTGSGVIVGVGYPTVNADQMGANFYRFK